MGRLAASEAGVTAMDDPVERLRAICLALPEVTERPSHGEPSWFVRDRRQFVTLSDHHHGDAHLSFWCAAAPGVQDALVHEAPDRYFVPPYVGHRGWLGVFLDVPQDWDELEELVVDAYRLVAPRRLVDLLDADGRTARAEN